MKKIIFLLALALSINLTSAYEITIDDSWTNRTFEKVLTSYQYTENIQQSLFMMQKCKQSKNPKWCFELIMHTWWHETKFWKASSKNTFGMLWYWWSFEYEVNLFIERFNQYWYKSNCKNMVRVSKYTATQKQNWISNCYRMQNNLTNNK